MRQEDSEVELRTSGPRAPVIGHAVKRIFDLVVATVLVVLTAPLLATIWLIIRLNSAGPAIFRQTRPGRNGSLFVLYKFRTMREPKDNERRLLSDGARMTRLGCFLRKTSLDELPQLLNVIKGDLSLVGPRPLLVEYYPFFTPREHLRHSVRPGITGWAQVNGRNLTSWDQRLEYDVYYVEHWSMALDMKILFRTLVRLLDRRDVVVDARSTMRNLDEERQDKIRFSG